MELDANDSGHLRVEIMSWFTTQSAKLNLMQIKISFRHTLYLGNLKEKEKLL